MKPIQEIEFLIKAHYPIIWIITWEENRVEKLLYELTIKNHLNFASWTLASGIKRGDPLLTKAETCDPFKILNEIDTTVINTMYILKDFHAFMKDPQIVRKIRDVAIVKTKTYSPIIVISPILNIPIELEKLITVIDYTLPTTKNIIEMIESASLVLNDNGESIDNIVKACQGLTSDEIENAFAKSWAITGKLDPKIITEEKKQIIRKSGILDYYDELESFNNIGGMAALKKWLIQRSKSFSIKAREYGLPTPKGLLLLGVPGSGKSLTCKTIANLWGVPLLKLDIGRLMAGIVGSSEENMRKAIRLAEACSPCILFVEEIDKSLSGAASSNYSDGGTINRVISTFLQYLADKTSPVFVVATANSVKELSPELLRKGRFDEIFYLGLPNPVEREEIIRIHIAKRKRNPSNFDITRIVASTDGFSGSEIEEAIIAAMFDVYSESNGEKDITTNDIIKAIKETQPLSVTMKEKILELQNWCSTRARSASGTNL